MSEQKTQQQLAQELFDHRADEGEWDDEAIPIARTPSGTTVMSVRLPTTEYRAMRQAAKAGGESLSDYVRRAVRERLEGRPLVYIHDSPSVAVGYRFDMSTPSYSQRVWNAARTPEYPHELTRAS